MYQKGLSNKSIADILTGADSTILTIADSSEPKSIDEIRSYGVNILGALKGPGSVLQGIQYVQNLQISITSRSMKTIKAYRNYLFKKDKNGKVLNEPDDTVHEWSNPMDAIRYGFSFQYMAKKKVDMARAMEDHLNKTLASQVQLPQNAHSISAWVNSNRFSSPQSF